LGGALAVAHPHESQRDATIREYARCPDCGEEQHDLEYETMQELIESVNSLAEFDAAFIAACDENKKALWGAASRINIDDLPPGQQEQVRRAIAESQLLNAATPNRLLH
jgi:hypothetical protein